MIRVRIKANGQVLDMVPAVARAMVLGGTAERVDYKGNVIALNEEPPKPETAALAPAAERAVTKQQDPPKKKPGGPKARSAK